MESCRILQAHKSADKAPSISFSYKNKGSSKLSDHTFTKNRLCLEKLHQLKPSKPTKGNNGCCTSATISHNEMGMGQVPARKKRVTLFPTSQ